MISLRSFVSYKENEMLGLVWVCIHKSSYNKLTFIRKLWRKWNVVNTALGLYSQIFLRSFKSYKENEMLLIQPWVCIHKSSYDHLMIIQKLQRKWSVVIQPWVCIHKSSYEQLTIIRKLWRKWIVVNTTMGLYSQIFLWSGVS